MRSSRVTFVPLHPRQDHRRAAIFAQQIGVRAGYRPQNSAKRTGSMRWSDMEPMTGIEPAYSAWEADVLPLNYIGLVASEG
jgi:hypothetical protein